MHIIIALVGTLLMLLVHLCHRNINSVHVYSML